MVPRLAEADPELLLTLANGQQRVSTTVSTFKCLLLQ
jgi:hypothetical protein